MLEFLRLTESVCSPQRRQNRHAPVNRWPLAIPFRLHRHKRNGEGEWASKFSCPGSAMQTCVRWQLRCLRRSGVPFLRSSAQTLTKIRELALLRRSWTRRSSSRFSETPEEELRDLLGPAGPLPGGVEKLLGGAVPRGGRVTFTHCSGVAIPESEPVAKAIRQHPRLKGYLTPHSPPGFLLIKPDSDPGNFVQRCRELGFEVDWR